MAPADSPRSYSTPARASLPRTSPPPSKPTTRTAAPLRLLRLSGRHPEPAGRRSRVRYRHLPRRSPTYAGAREHDRRARAVCEAGRVTRARPLLARLSGDGAAQGAAGPVASASAGPGAAPGVRYDTRVAAGPPRAVAPASRIRSPASLSGPRIARGGLLRGVPRSSAPSCSPSGRCSTRTTRSPIGTSICAVPRRSADTLASLGLAKIEVESAGTASKHRARGAG